jgi:hypothetical protein
MMCFLLFPSMLKICLFFRLKLNEVIILYYIYIYLHFLWLTWLYIVSDLLVHWHPDLLDLMKEIMILFNDVKKGKQIYIWKGGYLNLLYIRNFKQKFLIYNLIFNLDCPCIQAIGLDRPENT